MKKNKLLICDVDGTLVNSNAGFTLAIRDMMQNCFDYQIEQESLFEMTGYPLREIIEKFVGEIDHQTYHNASVYYRDVYNAKYITQISLYPHVLETLTEISKRCYLSTATNLPTRQTKLLFEKLNLSQCFDKIRGTDMDDHPKPNPALLYEAMEEFSIQANQTYMIGDSFNDIKAGKNAEVHTIAVLYGSQKRDIIETLNPEHTIERFNQLMDII